jgi:hypothetical protein
MMLSEEPEGCMKREQWMRCASCQELYVCQMSVTRHLKVFLIYTQLCGFVGVTEAGWIY